MDTIIVFAFTLAVFNTFLSIYNLTQLGMLMKKEANRCPHGYLDWNDCPVCGH